MAGHCSGAPVQPPSYDTVVPSAPSECVLHDELKSDDVTLDLHNASNTVGSSHARFMDGSDGAVGAEHLNLGGKRMRVLHLYRGCLP